MPSNQPEAPIPENWRKSVLGILRTGMFGRQIRSTIRVMEDWQADSLGAFPTDVRYPLIEALSKSDVIGKLEPDQPEPGVTYAFWMHHLCGEGDARQKRKFFAKICLFHDRITLKILSAHLPNWGDEHL